MNKTAATVSAALVALGGLVGAGATGPGRPRPCRDHRDTRSPALGVPRRGARLGHLRRGALRRAPSGWCWCSRRDQWPRAAARLDALLVRGRRDRPLGGARDRGRGRAVQHRGGAVQHLRVAPCSDAETDCPSADVLGTLTIASASRRGGIDLEPASLRFGRQPFGSFTKRTFDHQHRFAHP